MTNKIEVLPMPEPNPDFAGKLLAGIAGTLGVTYEQMCRDYEAGQAPARAEAEAFRRRYDAMIVAPFMLELRCQAMGLPRGMQP